MPWRAGIYNDNRPENVPSTIGWVCFILIFGFIVFNAFWPNNDVNICLDTIISVFGLYVVLKYAKRSVVAVVTGSGDSPDYLIVGITLSWLGQAARAAASIVTRLSGFDPVWLNSEIFAWIKLLTVIAAVCHVVPAGAIQRDGKESIPAPSQFGVAGAFIISIALTVVILVEKPDLKPYIDQMPSWSKDMFKTGQRLPPDETHG